MRPPTLSPPEAVKPSSAMPDWLKRAFLTSVKHYQAGMFEQARQLLIATLEREPRHSDSLYLLGSIAPRPDQYKSCLHRKCGRTSISQPMEAPTVK